MNQDFSSVTPEQLRERFGGDPGIAVIDVRSTAEFRSGHIPGARSLPLDDLFAGDGRHVSDVLGENRDTSVYLTCHAGLRARQAAEKLADSGYRNVILVEGGTEAWERAGLPMRRVGKAISLDRQVQIAVGALLILKVIFGFTLHELFFVLAALIGAGLITAGLTRWCGMAKLMALMPWNRRRSGAEQASA